MTPRPSPTDGRHDSTTRGTPAGSGPGAALHQPHLPAVLDPARGRRLDDRAAHEWHLLLPNPFLQGSFGLVSWLHEAVVRLGSALPSSRLISVGSITDAVAGDRIQQPLGEVLERIRVTPAQGDHGLERF